MKRGRGCGRETGRVGGDGLTGPRRLRVRRASFVKPAPPPWSEMRTKEGARRRRREAGPKLRRASRGPASGDSARAGA